MNATRGDQPDFSADEQKILESVVEEMARRRNPDYTKDTNMDTVRPPA